jgi:hypothetical protein
LNPKIVELFPGSKLCGEPSWLLATASPSLGRLLWISVLREHLRVGAPSAPGLSQCAIGEELLEPLLKLDFFCRYLARQNDCDLHVQNPKLVGGHQFEIVGFHSSYPKNWGVEPPDQDRKPEQLQHTFKRAAAFVPCNL